MLAPAAPFRHKFRAQPARIATKETIMAIRKASGQWDGGFKDGKGTMTPAHGAPVAFSAGSRFEDQPSSNPEELVGAALAGCFSMALTLNLEKAGFKPVSVRTSADVHLNKLPDTGNTITNIDLVTQVSAPGVDPAKFQEIALATSKGCPVARLFAAAKIGLQATLV
jgi:osmotically inducible protein OsmC